MADNKIVANNGSFIVLYSTDDGNIQLEVKLEKDSVWLNREQIAQLYGRDYKTIAKHINIALREELEGEPVVAKFATPKKYGRKEGYTQHWPNLPDLRRSRSLYFRRRKGCHATLSCGKEPFFQRWQQAYCGYALSLVYGEQRNSLQQRWSQTHCRQHTCGFDTNDCRKSHRRKRCDDKGGSQSNQQK